MTFQVLGILELIARTLSLITKKLDRGAIHYDGRLKETAALAAIGRD